MITLTASLSAAVVQRGEVAQHRLREAAGIAARVPDQPMDNWQSFSATNVNIWRVSVGVERGEAGGAMLKLAGPVTLDGLDQRSSRRAEGLAQVTVTRVLGGDRQALPPGEPPGELAVQDPAGSEPVAQEAAGRHGRSTGDAVGGQSRA